MYVKSNRNNEYSIYFLILASESAIREMEVSNWKSAPSIKLNCFYTLKMRLDILVDDDNLETVKDVILKSAATGKIGDGKIFVTTIDDVIRIRTGETGSDAI